jgi:magnesium-transporting ATPase (P-type)
MIKDNQNFDIRRTSIKQVKSDQFDKVSIQKSSSIKISSSGGAGSEIKLRKKNTVSKIKTKSIVHFGEQNPELKNLKLPDNTIRSTKYNIFTFLPKSLLFQFQRVANVYFLVISILTCMPFSPKQPSSMIGTFCFVLLCTMVKEAIEDYGRFKQDSKSNNKIVFKYSNNAWKNVKCSILKPGDLIKVVKEEEVTADILIIQSSNDTGYCYIDTKNLDGETNLKEKCALEEFKNLNENDYSSIIGSVECDKPDENLTSWEGSVYFQKHQTYTDLKNLILKGCTLKNTEYVIGIVIYSGHNTKIMKN